MSEDSGIEIEVEADFDTAVRATRLALRSHGFSVLSEMAAPVELGSGTGRRHLFLTVWEQMVGSANLGGQGLDVGDHLQMNIVVYEEGGTTRVAGLDPVDAYGSWPEAAQTSGAALAALEKVLIAVDSPPDLA